MLYSGIDLHKRTVVIATVDEKGKVLSEASIPTSRSAVARYVNRPQLISKPGSRRPAST